MGARSCFFVLPAKAGIQASFLVVPAKAGTHPMDSRLRGNDGRVWIPAFAGMTKLPPAGMTK